MNAIKVLLQEIDLSTLPLLRIENSFNIVSFHGIEIYYQSEYPTWFAIKQLAIIFTENNSVRVKKDNFFKKYCYKPIFDKENITIDNSYKQITIKGRGTGFFHTKTLWFAIHWLDPNLFIEKICEIYGHFNIYNHEIKTIDLYNYTDTLNKVSYFGLTASKDKTDHYLALKDIRKSLHEKYSGSYENDKVKAHSNELPRRIEIFHELSKWKDKKLEDMRNNAGVISIFTHPNLAVYYLDKSNFIEFWDTFLSFYEKENEIRAIEETQSRRYILDLKNSLVENINEHVGLAKLGDMIVKIHKDTSFIHVATTAKVLNPIKYTNFDRWFKLEDTKEYIEELENEIRNGEVITGDDKLSESKELERSVKFTEREKMKNSDTISISEQLNDHPSYFKLGLELGVDSQGYFFQPELFMYYLIYLDKRIAVKYIHMIFSILVGISSSNVSEKAFIDRCNGFAHRRIMELQNNIIDLEEENEAQRKEIERFEIANSGCLMLIDSPKGLQLRKSPYDEPDKPGRLVIRGIKNYEKIYEIVKDKMAKTFMKLQHGKYNTTLEESSSIIEDIVDDAKEEIEEPSTIDFVWNEVLYEKRKSQAIDNKSKGFLYESYCSKVLSAFVHEDLPQWFKTKFGLNNTDGGIDLFDLKNKILYQCKFYVKLKMSDALKRTNEAISSKIQAIDKDYIIKLVVPSTCVIAKDVKEMFGEDNIVRIDMEGEPRPIFIDRFNVPKSTVIVKKPSLKDRDEIFINECKKNTMQYIMKKII